MITIKFLHNIWNSIGLFVIGYSICCLPPSKLRILQVRYAKIAMRIWIIGIIPFILMEIWGIL